MSRKTLMLVARKARKRALPFFLTIATLVWSLGAPLGVLLPVPAQAAVAVEIGNWGNTNMMISSGMMQPIMGLKITGSAGETLNKITVKVANIASSGFDPNTDLAAFNETSVSPANDQQAICVYKDGNGNGWFDPGTGDTVLSWAVKPSWTDLGGGVWQADLDMVNDALPTSVATGQFNYFLHIKTATGATAGHSFKFTLAADAIATSANSPTITETNTAAFTVSGSGGGQMETPHIVNVKYRDYKTMDVEFNMNMDSTTTNCANEACANIYTLKTSAAGDTEQIVSATLQSNYPSAGVNKTVRLVADNSARISASPSDTITVSTDFQYAPKDAANHMPQSDGGPRNPFIYYSKVKISEVRLNGTQTTDEFVEIYNSEASQIDITGWKLGALISNAYSDLLTFGAVTMSSGKYYLVANSANDWHLAVMGTTAADASYVGKDLGLNDTIFLIDSNGFVRDMAGIGASAKVFEGNAYALSSDNFTAGSGVERKATPSSTTATMAAGGADASKGNSYDSDSNGFDFVLKTVLDPQNSSGATETAGGSGEGSYADQAPRIDHMPLINGVVGQELKIPARISDTEDTFSQLATKELCYKAGNASWPGTPVCVSGQLASGQDVTFTIPASAVTANGVNYYIHVKDSGNHDVYNCSSPSATTATTAQTGAYLINISSTTGSRSISGLVCQSAGCPASCTALAGATVYVEGTGMSATSASTTGAFVINSVPDGIYNLRATSGGYLDNQIWGVSVNMNNPSSSGWKFCMQTGTSGQGGDISKPHAIYTAPSEGMMGAPTNISTGAAPIKIGFDKNLLSSTVTTSNVLLKKMSGGTATTVSGYTVSYDSTPKEITLASSTALDPGYGYIVEITNAVTDEAGNSIQGTRVGGGHEFMFNTSMTNAGSFGGYTFTEGNTAQMMQDTGYHTMAQNYNSTTGKWTGGVYTPPYILGSSPAPGAFNVPANSKIVFTFSEALDSASVTTTNFVLAQIVSGAEIDKTATKVSSVSLDTSKKIVTMALVSGGMEVGQWRAKVKGGVRGSSGITLGDPANPTQDRYIADFNVSSTTLDSSGPTVQGTFPANNAANVPLDFGFIDIGFNEAIDPSTVNTSNISLKTGTTEVPATVTYDPINKSVKLSPSTGLMPGAKYTLTVSTAVKDLSGNAMSSASVTSFTMTSTMDTVKPRIEFANADDYNLAVTYSKPMNAAKVTDTNRWGSSVLNPANYAVKKDSTGPGNPGVDYTLPATASFTYEPETRTVKIKGLALGTMGFSVTVTGVTDILGNPIDTGTGMNMTGGPVMSSANTQGMIGPGGTGMMGMMTSTTGAGAGVMGGGSTTMNQPTGFGGYMASDMAMMPVKVQPMNGMAGATTTYFVDFPISASKAIDNGGSIKLTFPTGFTVSSVVPDPVNPNTSDMNMMGPGTVALKTSGVTADGASATTKGGAADDGVTVSGQTVTVHLGVTGNSGSTGAPDFLHMEVKGIVNSSIPKDFNTSGYTVDMKSYNAAGTMLESKTSSPFFITAAGTNTITVNVYLNQAPPASPDNKSCSAINMFMGSPMTGPQDATFDIAAGTGTKNFTTLPNGDYFVFMEPNFTCGDTKYSANTTPEPIHVTGSQTVTKNIVVRKMDTSTAAALTVKVSGTFTNESVDIFAGGPNGFTVETKTLNGTYTADTPNTTTIYLPANGTYSVGMGPAVPKGAMMGPPPMPDWMPPQQINIKVSGVGGTTAITDEFGNDVKTSGISFSIGSATKQISGIVTDGVATQTYANGTPIANAEIFAYQPMGFGGKGSHTQSKADGTFTLKIAEYGTYNVGAFSPGMPPSSDRTLDVRSGDGASTAVYVNNVLSTGASGATPFVIKLKKAAYTVSGKITDVNNNPLQYAPVWAKETTSGQMVNAGTDQNGNYILFVDVGTWNIRAEMPYGTDACGSIAKTVTVSQTTGSLSNQNIQPSVSESDCKEVSGTVTIGGAIVANIPVFIEGWDATNNRPSGTYHRDTMTDNGGAYRFKVGAGTYKIGTWTPNYGELTVSGGTVTVSASNITNADITVNLSALHTLSVPITGGTATMTGFLEFKGTNGLNRKGIPVKAGDLTGATPTLSASMPDGTYNILLHIDGVGDYSQNSVAMSGANATATAANFNITTTVTAAPIRAISGTVKDADGTAIKDALVWIQDPVSGLRKDTTTAANGTYSISIKQGTGYKIGVDKPDYTSSAPATLNITADATYNFDVAGGNNLIRNTKTISGTIYAAGGTTAMNEGFVWAERTGGGWSGGEIEPDGTYQLSVSDGSWTVKAIGPRHTTTTLATQVTVATGVTNTGKNITLTAKTANEIKTEVVSITPSVGGVIDDTADTGIKLIIPPNALGRDSNPATITIEETYDTPQSSSSKPLGESNIKITAKDYEGNAITSFNSDVEMMIKYDEAEVTAAGIDESDLNLTYWDNTTQQFVQMAAIKDTANNTISGFVDHFTSFAPTGPSDLTAPSTPTNVSATAGSSSITVSWTASTDNVAVSGYEVYRSTAAGGTFSNISGNSMATGIFNSAVLVTGTSYTDTTASTGTTYYYKVAAFDNVGNNSDSSSASSGAAISSGGGSIIMYSVPAPAPEPKPEVKPVSEQKAEVKPEVKSEVKSEVAPAPEKAVSPAPSAAIDEKVIPARPKEIAKVNLTAEKGAYDKLVSITRAVPNTPAQWKVVHFLAYGAGDASKKAGTGERESMVKDFKAIYGKLPETAKQWNDVEKIMKGDRPESRNLEMEKTALKDFTKVYKRLPDFKNAEDKKAFEYMSYHLRINVRNLTAEKAAITSFKTIYKKVPASLNDWAVIRAIAYSGAEK